MKVKVPVLSEVKQAEAVRELGEMAARLSLDALKVARMAAELAKAA